MLLLLDRLQKYGQIHFVALSKDNGLHVPSSNQCNVSMGGQYHAINCWPWHDEVMECMECAYAGYNATYSAARSQPIAETVVCSCLQCRHGAGRTIHSTDLSAYEVDNLLRGL